MLPVIGVSPAYYDGKMSFFLEEGNELFYLYIRYVRSISKAGGLPIILPPLQDGAHIMAQMERVDGLLLSGGRDFLPRDFKKQVLTPLRDQSPLRYDYELILLDMAKALDLPVLAICRGHQMMGEWGGGRLCLDIEKEIPEARVHHQDHMIPHDAPSHPLLIERDTLLYHLLKKREVLVNSLHRQALVYVGPSFTVSGRADDGIIEAIEGEESRFFLGLQFHPELLIKNNQDFSTIFKAFVEACQRKRRK